jgi:hypothetical protein
METAQILEFVLSIIPNVLSWVFSVLIGLLNIALSLIAVSLGLALLVLLFRNAIPFIILGAITLGVYSLFENPPYDNLNPSSYNYSSYSLPIIKSLKCPKHTSEIPMIYKHIDSTSAIKLKGGVSVQNLDSRLAGVLPLIQRQYKMHTSIDMVITSGNDSEHSHNSKHYKNQAIDLRIRGLSGRQASELAKAITRKLGMGYRVLYGDSGHKDHIHVSVLKSQGCRLPRS